MRVLLLGSGGREHALSWKMAQSSMLEELFIAPGNAGTKQHGKNVNINPTDFEGIKKFVLENNILTHLGKISYGLYLYHLFTISTFWDYISPNLHLYTDNKHTAWILYFVFTYLAAEISYQFIEKPFNYLKKYFA